MLEGGFRRRRRSPVTMLLTFSNERDLSVTTPTPGLLNRSTTISEKPRSSHRKRQEHEKLERHDTNVICVIRYGAPSDFEDADQL